MVRSSLRAAVLLAAGCGRIGFVSSEDGGATGGAAGDGAPGDSELGDAMSSATADAAPACPLGQACTTCSLVSTSAFASSATLRPATTADPNGWYFVWSDDRDSMAFRPELYFARFDPNGAGVGAEVRLTTRQSTDSLPAIASSATGLTLASTSSDTVNGLYAAQFDPTGAPINTAVHIASLGYNALTSSIVASPSGFGVAWEKNVGAANTYHVFFARLDSAGALLGSEVTVENPSYTTAGSSIAWGSSYAIAWSSAQTIFDPYQVKLARYSSAGALLGQVNLGQGTSPSIASGGTELAVVWRQGSEIWFVRRGLDGTDLGPALPIVSSSTASAPVLAARGAGYALAWVDRRDGNREIYAALLDATGTLVSPEIRVTTTSVDEYGVRLSAAGAQRLGLGWADAANSTFALVDCP